MQPTPAIQYNEPTQVDLPISPAHPNDLIQQSQTNEPIQQKPIVTPPSIEPLEAPPVSTDPTAPQPPTVSSIQSTASWPVQVPELSILTPFQKIEPLDEDGKTRFMPGCFVHKRAKLGKNVYIGLFVYVGADAVIGNHVVLLEDVVIAPKTIVPDNQIVIPDPITTELVEMLQDLEDVNPNFKEKMMPKVDAILKQEK